MDASHIFGSVLKDRTMNLRLSTDDQVRLRRLSEHYAIGASSVIRMLIKRAADELPPEQEKPQKKPKK